MARVAQVAAVFGMLLVGCSSESASSAENAEFPVVVSTVAPVTDLVRHVQGDRGELHGLVPDGVDSHTHEPAPEDARLLGRADLLVANGLFLEEPVLQLAEVNLPEDSAVLTLADRTISEEQWQFDHSFPRARGVPNPHLWLDVHHAMTYVELIGDALVAIDPDGAQEYEANAAAYLEQLRTLDDAISQAISTIPDANRKLITYHDSWPYLGERYDIEVVAAAQPSDFSEPSAKDVRAIIEQVRDAGVPAVFGSEVFPSDVIRTIAEETGAEYVEELSDDELPSEPGDPRHSYVGMMEANVRTMVTHLGGDPSSLERLQMP